jgi:plastocyanin
MRATARYRNGLALTLVVAAAVLWPAVTARASTSTTITAATPTTTTTTKRQPTAAAVSNAVSATISVEANCGSELYCFSPASVTVSVGDTVRWSNGSGAAHTVTRCTPANCDGRDGGTGTDGSFTELDVGVGAAAAHTFSAPGTYNYYCTIHGYGIMHGTVTVQVATPSTTSPPTGTTAPPATNGNGAVANGASGNGAGTATTIAGPTAKLANTGTSTLPLAIACVLVAAGLLLAVVRRPRRDGTLRG